MKKVFSTGVILLSGITSVSSTSADGNYRSPLAEYRQDPRARIIRDFFDKGDCPAAELAEEFLLAADRNGLDWRLLPSLAMVESTGGKYAQNNNMFGWGCGRARFSSVTEGVHLVADRLANADIYRRLPLERKLRIYNPELDEYPNLVREVMGQISRTDGWPAVVELSGPARKRSQAAQPPIRRMGAAKHAAENPQSPLLVFEQADPKV